MWSDNLTTFNEKIILLKKLFGASHQNKDNTLLDSHDRHAYLEIQTKQLQIELQPSGFYNTCSLKMIVAASKRNSRASSGLFACFWTRKPSLSGSLPLLSIPSSSYQQNNHQTLKQLNHNCLIHFRYLEFITSSSSASSACSKNRLMLSPFVIVMCPSPTRSLRCTHCLPFNPWAFTDTSVHLPSCFQALRVI